ncbi:uncharacterized protein LOC142348702 [Convolutriloba macropyga]|uniref:uncharacterized protein LOC142348702 n=1 Tax=Convolutriloba macropyga TaxID=536237 RepID=UPI003F51D0AD
MVEKPEVTKNYFWYVFVFVLIVSTIYQMEVIFYHRSTTTRRNFSQPIKIWSQVSPGDWNSKKQNTELASSSLTSSNSKISISTDKILSDSAPIENKLAIEDEIKALNCSEIQNLLLQHGFGQSNCNGRLGNQLGLLALGLAVNLQFGSKLVLNEFQNGILARVFDMESICRKDGSSICISIPKECSPPQLPREKTISPSRGSLWEKGLLAIGGSPSDVEGRKIKLPQYPEFLPWITATYYYEFRTRVRFREDVWKDAEIVLNHLNSIHDCTSKEDCTVVFVHMRMGDYLRHLRALGWGPSVFDETNYMQEAFKTVVNSYKKPVFYILGYTSRDVEGFFKSHEGDFRGMKIVIVAPIQSKLFNDDQKDFSGIDMALMAMSDVLILSYGSYGDFGALFGKDKKQVLYPKGHKTHDETGVNMGLPRFVPIPWKLRNKTIN